MPFFSTPIAGLQIFEPRVFADERGYFYEAYNEKTFQEQGGIDSRFVQDNQAASSRGVLRGLHFQHGTHAQAKLVRCLQGEVYDVAVDLRPDSPSRYQWFGIYLSAENHRQLYVPRGFAHGYLVLSQTAIFAYKCDNYYEKSAEDGLHYADPRLGICWPELPGGYLVNARDEQWALL